MDRDGVFDANGIASSEGDEDRNVAGASGSEDKFVATLESVESQCESAELVFAKGVCTGDVRDKLGLELAHELGCGGMIALPHALEQLAKLATLRHARFLRKSGRLLIFDDPDSGCELQKEEIFQRILLCQILSESVSSHAAGLRYFMRVADNQKLRGGSQ